MTVPQIFIGATHVGGCDDLYALERAGKLDPLLAGTMRRGSDRGLGMSRQGCDLHRRPRADALGPVAAGQSRRGGAG